MAPFCDRRPVFKKNLAFIERGMSMVMLDKDGGVAGTVPPVDFYPQGSDWPDARPFFVKVVEGEGKTSWGWDNSNRTLIVNLPKAEVARFELSSYLGGGQTGSHNQSILGVWNWIEQAQPSNLTMMRTAVVQGRFWMLTSSREMVLVHAGRRLVYAEILKVPPIH
ncbi:MAG TPA: hypothetical protein VNM47_06930 [Terriglobia bacterium]|nr:hypothetical protein [Terriglobia bacterium]